MVHPPNIQMKNRKENEMEASIVRKKRKVWVILVPAIILLVLLCGVVVGFTVLGTTQTTRC